VSKIDVVPPRKVWLCMHAKYGCKRDVKVSGRIRKRESEICEEPEGVESLLVDVVDETLKHILGEDATEIVYDYLENNSSLRLREMILQKPEVFSAELRKFLGSGALVLEKEIVGNLYSELQLELEEKEGFSFADHLKSIRQALTHKSAAVL